MFGLSGSHDLDCVCARCTSRRESLRRDDAVLDGYRIEWVPDEGWRMPADGRACSKHGCLNPAIALLRRSHARFVSGFALWGYCVDHLYGLGTIRKIEDGIVKVRRLVKIEELCQR